MILNPVLSLAIAVPRLLKSQVPIHGSVLLFSHKYIIYI